MKKCVWCLIKIVVQFIHLLKILVNKYYACNELTIRLFQEKKSQFIVHLEFNTPMHNHKLK